MRSWFLAMEMQLCTIRGGRSFSGTWSWRMAALTWVTEEEPDMEDALIRAVVSDDSESKVTVNGVADRPGIAATLFRELADAGVNVDMIVQNVSDGGVTDISFTVPHEQIDGALEICGQQRESLGAAAISSDDEIAKVSLVGAGMKSNPGVAATMFETLAGAGINIEMISTSAIRISCVVAQGDADRAVQLLHSAYELDKTTF